MSIQKVVTVSRTVKQYNRCNAILNINYQRIEQHNRFVSIRQQNQTKALKNEKEKIRNYVVQKYLDYVKNYTKVLETRFPTAMRMYRVFSVGIKEFLRDLKTYLSLRVKISKDQGFTKLSRQEIELYHKMPSDMWRIAPVLILSAIPFGNYIIFPLAFLKPRTLLCSHFWSIQQRAEFSIQDLKDRLKNNRPVFRALQVQLDSIPEGESKENWRRVVGLLGSGGHPTPTEVIACKELFIKEPYQLTNLTLAHLGCLLKMHGLRKSLFRKNKLKYRAFLLMEMDKAIIREGGVEQMTTDCLRYACHIRGLNSSHLTNQSMRDWLSKWLQISKSCDKNSYSLILHCPIFLAYNHPQNWMLIY